MRFSSLVLVLILSGLVALSPAYAQQAKTISDTFDLSADGNVVVDTYKGSIQVTTWDRDEVMFEVRIEADDDEDLVELTEIEVDHSRNTLRLKTDYERAKRERRGLFSMGSVSLPFAHYTIRMPRTARLNIDDYKSNIDIADIAAAVSIDSYKGIITVSNVNGTVLLDTYKGEAVIENLDGALRADTYKGTIRADLVDMAGNSHIDTYKGDVRITVADKIGFDLAADLGRRGDLETNIDRRELSHRRNEWRGSINGGGPNLSFETYRGKFELQIR